LGETRPLTVRYTLEAAAELELVLDTIAAQSPRGARRVHERILATIFLLSEQPHSGSRTSDPRMRRIVARPYPYLIFYQVKEAELIILAVRHGARNPATMPDKP
jgi:toxin ParE1/3/4